jgi:WD40-like Beta Propeller Repeat/PEGA domain
MRVFPICLFASMLVGCATNRTVTISTIPPFAMINVDGHDVGKAPVTQQLTWNNDAQVHVVRADKAGYTEATKELLRDDASTDVLLELSQDQEKLTIHVDPVPAIVKVDGNQLSPEPTSDIETPPLNFTIDAKGNWTTHTITAERTGFQIATATAKYSDPNNPTATYTLTLEPLSKKLNVTTNLPDAKVYFDDDTKPLEPGEEKQFQYDTQREDWVTHRLTAKRAGYPDNAIPMSWDDGKTDYSISLAAKAKSIRIHTTPPGAVVTMDDKELPRDPATGDSIAVNTPFPPVDEKGTLKTYNVMITKPEENNVEWYPKPMTISWDDGKTAYDETLDQIRTVTLPLLTFQMTKGPNGWDHVAKTVDTLAAKDVNEPSGMTVQRLTPEVAKGQSIDSIAVSPDGSRLIFTVLVEKPSLHSLMYSISTDGKGVAQLMNDGKSLDVTPSFSPDGSQILFSSDRAASRLNVWGIAADGARLANVYTSGFTNDLWPTMDSDPKANIYCESYTDRQDLPRIYKAQVGTIVQADLGVEGAHQPRINPTNDTVLFSEYNAKTGKRDIFTVGVNGGITTNLTNTPDADEYDAVWDRSGARIAYVSDLGEDKNKQHNANIWARDLDTPNSVAKQITFNVSQDDCPVWDPSGRAIYFRSNRGGEWGIWKIELK